MKTQLYPRLFATICEVLESIPEPTPSRKDKLTGVVNYLSTNRDNKKLTFVCTHNSRRSHMAQFWAAAAAEFYNIENVTCYSAGTEATAMHPHTVEALVECGFEIQIPSKRTDNPEYLIRLGGLIPKMTGFSKALNHESLPSSDFCAVMVCTDAEEACPFVPGATKQVSVTYDDPKSSDGTPKRRTVYLQRSKEIAREMLWIFEQLLK
jgi:arsenate reductase